MHMNAMMIPLAATIALLMLAWYVLAMPVYLHNARSASFAQTPSASVVLEAGR